MTHSAPASAESRTEGGESWSARLVSVLFWIQGIYYLVTGVWPLVSIETFQMVTGRKTDNLVTGREGDHWLVMTVGVLITAIALTLLVAAWRRKDSPEATVLAVASAVGLTAIDIVFVVCHVIPPIYLLDAVAEILLMAGWACVFLARTPSKNPRDS